MHKLTNIASQPRSVVGAFTLLALALSTQPVSAQDAAPAAKAELEAETSEPKNTAQGDTTSTDAEVPEQTEVSQGEGSEGAETSAETPADAPPAPPTPEQQQEAMTAFEAGRAAFDEEDYEEAVTQFKKAYAAIPSPHAEYWIAVSLDRADPEDTDPEKTAKAYQVLLNNPAAAHVGTEKVEEAKNRFLELRKFLPAKITIVSTPPGASVKLDGEPQQGVTPIDLEVNEGTHVIELSLEGYQDAIVDAEVSGGVHLEQQVQMTELPPPPPPPSPVAEQPTEEKNRSIVPAAVTLGLGGAGLVAGTVFGIMALSAKSKFKDDPTSDHADAAERNALIADMSFGVALTLGITGIVLLTSKESTTSTARQKPRKEFLVAPYASPRGAGAAARLTF